MTKSDPSKDALKAQKSIQSAFQRAADTNTNLPSGMSSYANTGHQSFLEQAAQNPLTNIVRTGGEILNRGNQGVMQSAQKILGNAEPSQSWSKIFSNLGDIKGEHDINARQEFGIDKNAGGRLAGLVDTLGMVAQDPLTYMTLGTSALAKVGIKAAESALGKEAAIRLASKGLDGFSSAEQQTLKSAIARNSAAKDSTAFAEKVMKKVEKPQGVKLAGQTVIPKSVMQPLTDLVSKSPVGKVSQNISDLFVPRAKLAREAGPVAAENTRRAEVRAETEAANHQQQLQNALKAAVKPGQLSQEDLHQISLAKQTGNTEAQQAIFHSQGHQAASNLMHVLDQSAKHNQKALIKAGFGPETVSKINDTKVLTPKAEKWVEANPAEAAALGLEIRSQSGLLHALVPEHSALDPNASVQDLNAKLSKKLGFDPFETNPIVVAQTSAKHTANLIQSSKTINELKTLEDGKGNPLLITGKEKPAAHSDYVPVSLGELGTGWVPAPLQQHFAELNRATSPQGISGFSKFLKEWTTLWKGYATVPFLFGAGFHERNLVGNLWNMYIRGFSDPSALASSVKAVQSITKGERSGLSSIDSIAKSSLADEDKHAVQEAIKEGIVNKSFFHSDFQNKSTIHLSKTDQAKALLNPVSNENAIIKPGRAVGSFIEDANRLAMFMSEMRKHGDPKLAAQLVKETLFDYGDLTKADAAIKTFVPFWTWTSKNIPAQIRGIMEHPGRVAQPAHLQTNLEAGAPDTQGQPLTNYAVMNNEIPLVGGKNPILGTASLPSGSALQTIQPLLQLLTQAPGGPKSLRPEAGGQDIAQSVASLIGGGPLNAVKGVTEAASGKSAFTGAPVNDPGAHILKSILPLISKGQSLGKKTSDSSTRKAAIISALTGLTTAPITPKSIKSESIRRSISVNTELKKQKVPTKKELGLKTTKASSSKKKVPKAFQAPKVKASKTVR